MCSKALQPSSLVVVFETFLSSAATTVDEEKGNPSWQPCADFYITCILSCLPWGGAELMEVKFLFLTLFFKKHQKTLTGQGQIAALYHGLVFSHFDVYLTVFSLLRNLLPSPPWTWPHFGWRKMEGSNSFSKKSKDNISLLLCGWRT